MATATLVKYEYLGITDDETACSCCGRVDLKATIALKDVETGQTVYMGRTCGARALRWTVKDLDRQITATKQEAIERQRAAQFAFDTHPEIVAMGKEVEAFWMRPDATPVGYRTLRAERGWTAMQDRVRREVGLV